MVHIPKHLHLPQDKVRVLDKGCVADPERNIAAVDPYETVWHIQDFREAAMADPERYVLADLPAPGDPERAIERVNLRRHANDDGGKDIRGNGDVRGEPLEESAPRVLTDQPIPARDDP